MDYRNRTRTFDGSAFDLWQAGHFREAMARWRHIFVFGDQPGREPLIEYTGTAAEFERDYEAAYHLRKSMGLDMRSWDAERRDNALRKEARELWRAGKHAEAFALDHSVQFAVPPARPEDWYELTPKEMRRALEYRKQRGLEMAGFAHNVNIDAYTKWYAEWAEGNAIYGRTPSASAIKEYNRRLSLPGHDPITDSVEVRRAGVYLHRQRVIAEHKPIDDE